MSRISKFKKILILSYVTLVFASCGDQMVRPLTARFFPAKLELPRIDPINAISQDMPRLDLREVVFIVHGGFNSCAEKDGDAFGLDPLRMDYYPQFKDLISQLKDRFPRSVPRVLVGCLSKDSPLEGKTYYRWNNQPIPYTIHSRDIGEMIRDEIYDLGAPVFFIGHSYGAWLALNIILSHGNEFNTAGLFTVDAISPVDCTPMQIVSQGPGCFRGPRDVNTRAVSKLAPNWHNFYQTSDTWLHSSRVRNKSVQNYEIHYANGDGHRIIDSDPRVWAQISHSVFTTLERTYK